MERSLAAWQRAVGIPLEIGEVETPLPGPAEILVRNRAIAINPVDWILQESSIFPWLDYPTILGSDVAGDVVAVGSDVERFKVGDRVLGQSVGATTNRPTHGAFQTFTLILENMASRLPANLPYTEAAVLPLGFGTAACSLFEVDHLALRYPTLTPQPTDETILVWGGSSSVGCNAIQLAVAAGYRCITTASPSNMKLVEQLGASAVFDYSDPEVVELVICAIEGKAFAGALHATGNMHQCFDAVSRSGGRKFVSTTLSAPENRPAGVETKLIFGTSLKDSEVSRAVYADFLSEALAAGRFRCAPAAHVIGKGLESLQAALEAHKRGVSAAKIVVVLGDS
jgi:NADPH:quinone reductase-like Zn-dependent oxidoreductase